MEPALRKHTLRLAAVIATQNEILTAERSLQAIMNVIVEQTQAITQADGAVVELVDGEELVYRAVSGTAVPYLGLHLCRHSSFSGRCIQEGRALLCSDALSDPRVNAKVALERGTRSIIVVPLLHQQTPIGVLKVLSSRPHVFEEEDASTLQLMTGMIAAAMSDAIAREAEHNLVAERTAALETLRKSEERFRCLATATDVLLWTADPEGNITDVSSNGLAYTGAPLAELRDRRWLDLVHPHDRQRTLLCWAESITTKTVHENEYRLRRHDGVYRHFKVRGVPILEADGTVREWMGQCQDVTEHREAQEAIRRSEARFRAAIEGSVDAFILLEGVRDSSGKIMDFVFVDTNHCWTKWTGLGRVKTLGRSLSEMWPEECIAPLLTSYRRVVDTQLTLEEDGEMILPGIKPRWTHSQVVPIGDCVAVTMRDISERKWFEQRLEEQIACISQTNMQLEVQQLQLAAANARLEVQAQTDGLTGLKNHRTFHERLAEEIQRTLRYTTPLSLILIDVDHFKQYNDRFGHPAGDRILQQVGQLLQAKIRTTDVAARYGGEEFVLILPHTDAEGACRLAEILRRAFEEARWPDRAITASFGVATWSAETSHATDFVGQADEALYYAKRKGRNSIAHFLTLEKLQHQGSTGTEIDPDVTLLSPAPVTPPAGLTAELMRTYNDTIEGWSHLLDLRDKETEGHALRVTEMSLRLAQRLGLSAEEQLYLRWGALLHDVGKMVVPDNILLKPGPLTPEERDVMRQHPNYAYEMLSPIPFLRPALDVPRYHHEKWDGSGYPCGLEREQIPLTARLFAVVDVWDALRNDRPYRNGWSDVQVVAYLQTQTGAHFDPAIVPVFLDLLASDHSG